MKLKILLLIIFYITLVKSDSTIKIPKCCPTTYELNSELNGCIKKVDNKRNLLLFIQKHMENSMKIISIVSPENTTKNINVKCKTSKIKSYKLEKEFILTPSGISTGNLTSRPEYCVDSTKDGTIMVLTCPCAGDTCVHFCCEKGYVVDTSRLNSGDICVLDPHAGSKWQINSKPGYSVVRRHRNIPHCKDGSYALDEATDFDIFPNGSLSFFEKDVAYMHAPQNYCIDTFYNEHGNETLRNAIICFTEFDRSEEIKHAIVYGIFFLIGAIFLLATLFVYALLPDLRQSCQGLSLMAHCACMFVAYISLIIAKAEGHNLEESACHFIAYLIQYSLLTGFFWMNVICLEVSSLIRYSPCVQHSNLSEKQRFYLYTIYAMGLPFVIFIITITLNSVDKVPDIFNPEIGFNSCWFSDNANSKAIVFFLYGPMGVVLFCNTVLFLTEVVQIKCSCCLLNQDGYKLFFKMCILMGVPWISEIISWAVGGKDDYWYFTDAVNILRSVFIFIIFCCRVKTLKELKYKLMKVTQMTNIFSMNHFHE